MASCRFCSSWSRLRMRRVQADVVVDLDDLLLGEVQRRPGLVVEVVGVGNDGVEAVVAAGHLDDDEDGVLAGLGGLGGVEQELRHQRSRRRAATCPCSVRVRN